MVRRILSTSEVRAAARVTIPVLLGYIAIGVAFGLLLVRAGYPWILAPVMSVLIYAGAGQYIAVSLFAHNASLGEILMLTLLVNARHMVYGLSLLDTFRGMTRLRWYMVFALTDETYALLTTVKPPVGVDPGKFAFYIALFDHIYWIGGGVIGALVGSVIPFNTKGLDFALTALFIVLLIEQYRAAKSRIPFAIALVVSVAAVCMVSEKNMLIAAILGSIALLFLVRRRLSHNAD